MRITSARAEYEIQEPLGQNGKFGSVYRGIEISGQNPVIIKQLAAQATPEQVIRFSNEFNLAVRHQQLITAIDFFSVNGIYYLIRPYVRGRDASAFIRKQKISVSQLFMLAKDILPALHHLHTQGILHTDIKPSNIILSEIDGQLRAYLTDLGLARHKNTPIHKRPFALLYSPPEQVLQYHSLMNASSDIYSTGVTLYELISGYNPFKHNNPELAMHLQLTQSPEPLQKKYSAIFKVLQKATAKPNFVKPPHHYTKTELENMLTESMSQRYQSAEEMLGDLHSLRMPPDELPWWRRWFYT